jgi:hypothetical protein
VGLGVAGDDGEVGGGGGEEEEREQGDGGGDELVLNHDEGAQGEPEPPQGRLRPRAGEGEQGAEQGEGGGGVKDEELGAHRSRTRARRFLELHREKIGLSGGGGGW